MRNRNLIITSALAAIAATASAITVPDDQPTIVAAIGALGGTGTVLVRNTHTEAGFTLCCLTGPLEIISVDGANTPTPGASVGGMIIDADDPVTFEGLTIGSGAGGFAILYTGNSYLASQHTLRNCILGPAGGAGIEIPGIPAGLNLFIEDSVIDNNGGNGISVFAPSTVTFAGTNSVSDNATGIAAFATLTLNSTGSLTVSLNSNEGVWLNSANCVVDVDGGHFDSNNVHGFSNNGQSNLTATFTDTSFSNNNEVGLRLTGNGATLDGTVTLDRCTLTGNTPPGSGGGILVADGIDLEVRSSLIAKNETGIFSGAIRCENQANLKVVGCTIADNFSSNATFLNADQVSIDGGTASATAHFVNCVFTGADTSIEGGFGGQISNSFFLNCLIDTVRGGDNGGFNGSNYGGNGAATFTASVSAPADLVDIAADDFAPNVASATVAAGATQAEVDAAFGAGFITLPAFDLNGTGRPNPGSDTRSDIGAIEIPVSGSRVAEWEMFGR
ncbi:MAG: right-handed parallel beta-helix repeat-containing protein [Candidatus Sumerlaeia bacterium]|nr:right-handed parallel beta-helix repeat-containing protein [Candidatus Sumerlaeia bacterium]